MKKFFNNKLGHEKELKYINFTQVIGEAMKKVCTKHQEEEQK